MSSTSDHKPVKFGNYILLDRINVGGMAEVFRGKSQGVEGFERLVALKRILPSVAADPDFVEMFVDEAKLAVQLQHANIAQIYDLGKVEDNYYIAMEYISGVDLRTMWDRARGRNRLLPIAMSCYIIQRCCEGLDFAHRKKAADGTELGLVHRDVSPQNILVSFEGEVKVIDFGIAKSKSKVSKTQAGVLKGKFGYMSPEQVRGHELDNRSDIFALGAVLYELVVGDRLFLGESDFSTLEKVRNVEMVPPTRLNKSLSPHLERIVMKALAKNREDRYTYASEMAEDLQRFLFSSNQAFSRTDMQRYLGQHFAEEMTKEKERLDRYKDVTFASFAEPEPPPRPAASGFSAPEVPARSLSVSNPKYDLHDPAEGSAPTALRSAPGLQAKPLSLSDMAVGAPPSLSLAPPPKPRLPAWAAGLIGALAVVALGGAGFIVHLLTSKPANGSMTVQVSPARADIYVNDKLVSNDSPFTLDHLAPNTYVLQVKKAGYEPVIRAISIGEGESRREVVELEKKKGTSILKVRSEPEGLAIFIDDADTGRVTPASITGVESGEHRVTLKRGDRIVTRVRTTIADGSAEEVSVDTARLPSILDVTSDPPAARVSVNGQDRGKAPITLTDLRPGATKVLVSMDGCTPFESTLDVERATVTPVHAKLECGVAKP